MKKKGYVGTYTKRDSEGIYSFEYQDGEIGNLALWAQVKNPKYLCFAGDYIASICEFEKGAGVALFDLNANKLDEIEFEKVSSCYLTYHEGKLYTANYHEGCIHVIAVKDGKLTLMKRVNIKPNAGTHQIVFWEDKFIVPCLLLDKLFLFDKNFQELAQIPFESAAGPRHGLFIPDSPYLYVVGETSNDLFVVDLKLMKVVGKESLIEKSQKLNLKRELAMEENEEPYAASAIRYYEGKLYVSIRGADVISVLEIDEDKMPNMVKNISSFGKHPRDFLIIDHYLLIANRESDNVVLFDLKNLKEETSGEQGAKTVLEGAYEGISVLLSE